MQATGKKAWLRTDCRHEEHGMLRWPYDQMPRKVFSNSRQGFFFFLVPWIHAINVSSRRLNACTVEQPCPQVLLSIVTHSTEMLGCSWALFWSETTLFERKSSCCFSNLLKSHSQSAAWTRLNQFWLPLLYTNMQNYPSRLWSLNVTSPFVSCF